MRLGNCVTLKKKKDFCRSIRMTENKRKDLEIKFAYVRNKNTKGIEN